MFVPILMFATAAGFALFWIGWTRSEHTEPWLPKGYMEHERPFIWSDGVAAVLLVVAGLLVLAGFELGQRLALVAAGMLWFLVILDTAYFAQNRLFARSHDGLANALTVMGLATVGTVIIVAYGF